MASKAVKRLAIENCCAILVDVQEFFLSQLDGGRRAAIERSTASFTELVTYLKIPLLATLERPVPSKGRLPVSISKCARSPIEIHEKDFFDLSREPEIEKRLASLGKKQIVLTGCETDVCVLQSCLGLLSRGYDVFVVEDLLFSSTSETAAALGRMRAEGAVFLTYKTLFHELLLAIESGPHRKALSAEFGEFPPSLLRFMFA